LKQEQIAAPSHETFEPHRKITRGQLKERPAPAEGPSVQQPKQEVHVLDCLPAGALDHIINNAYQ
jgi:hypothetical protein